MARRLLDTKVREQRDAPPVLQLPQRPPLRSTAQVDAEAPGLFAAATDWEALRPRGLYPRLGRPLVNALLLAITLPIALPPLLLLTLLNACACGGLRQAFFVQRRVGYRGRVFRIVKFRTLRATGSSSMSSWSNGQDALRVTGLGRILRNTHLDELPQLWNILRGEMTFIGPRPEMLAIEEWAATHVPGFAKRLALKPGITGFAQITQGYTGRDVGAYRKKLEINEIYRRNVRLGVDLEILARTVAWMLRGRGWSCVPGRAKPAEPERLAPGGVEPLRRRGAA